MSFPLNEYEAEFEAGVSSELDRLLENLSEFEYEAPPPPPKRTVSGGLTILAANVKVIPLRGFGPKSAKPTSQHASTISAIAKAVVSRFGSTNQVNRIQLTGHAADSLRSLDDDLDIGLRRGRAVRKIFQALFPLISLGSTFTEPTYQECSAGSSQPDSSSASDNRRVVVTLL